MSILKKKPEAEGLFNRVYSTLSMLKNMPDKMSEDEVEGMLKVLPADTANTLQSLFKPSIQEVSIVFLKNVLNFMEEAKRGREEGKKIVLLPFNFPPEIIYAFDNLVPLSSEVMSIMAVGALDGQGERYWDYAMGLGLPDHLCSAHLIELGSLLSGEDFKPDAMISGSPGACDVNAKTHEFVSLHLDIPQIVFEKPADSSLRGLNLYKKYFYKKVIKELEDLAGEKLKEENLRRVAERVNRCTELYYDLWEMKKVSPCPVPGIFSLFLAGTRFSIWGTDEAVSIMEKMVRVSRQNLNDKDYAARGEKARIIFTLLSYYTNFVEFYDWMDNNRIITLGDFLQLAYFEPIDLSSRESMLDGILLNPWNSVMTRQMGSDNMSLKWVDDIVNIIREWNLDAVIYCGHHSCKHLWSVFSITRNEVYKRSGVPMLGLQGDTLIRTMTPISIIQQELDQFIRNVVIK